MELHVCYPAQMIGLSKLNRRIPIMTIVSKKLARSQGIFPRASKQQYNQEFCGIANFEELRQPSKVITFILSFDIKWFPVVNPLLETNIDMKKYYGVKICVCVAVLYGAPLPVSAKNELSLQKLLLNQNPIGSFHSIHSTMK